MTLREWLKTRGHSHDWLAQELHVTRQAVSAWVHGSRVPRIQYLARIERLSGGLLNASSFCADTQDDQNG
jgi:predicted transcriptional regulator